MKILIISSYLPYPLFSGGYIRLFNFLKELSSNNEITLLCEKRDYQTQKDVAEINKFCKEVITVPRKKQWTLPNILKTGLSSSPFLMTGHKSEEMKKAISQKLEDQDFDLIHVETFYVMQNLPNKIKTPVVLGEQNIEYLVYQRFADQANFFVRQLLYIDIAKIKSWEENFWQQAHAVIVTSNNEKREVEKYNKNVTVVPNGVDLEKYKVSSSKYKRKKEGEKRILFIGDFRWIENKDAASWLLKEIWRELEVRSERLEVNLKLWIVGKNIPDYLKRLGRRNVIFDENAGDTIAIFKKAGLLLAPIRVGGGGKFKILESMASGVPVVTTSIGIEGIEGQDNKEVLIGDTAGELVDKTIKVLTDDNLYKSLQKNARLLIEKKHDWKIIVSNLEKTYQKLL